MQKHTLSLLGLCVYVAVSWSANLCAASFRHADPSIQTPQPAGSGLGASASPMPNDAAASPVGKRKSLSLSSSGKGASPPAAIKDATVNARTPLLLDPLRYGPLGSVGKYLNDKTRNRVFTALQSTPNEVLQEMLEPNAIRYHIYESLAKIKVNTANADADANALYTFMGDKGYAGKTKAMMLNPNTPNEALVGLVQTYRSYGYGKLTVPLHGLFAFSPSVAMKLYYLTCRIDGGNTSPITNNPQLGIMAQSFRPVTWIEANTASPDGNTASPDGKYDTPPSAEPWSLPKLDEMLTVFPLTSTPIPPNQYEDTRDDGYRRVLAKSGVLGKQDKKWISFGGWTQRDMDVVLKIIEGGTEGRTHKRSGEPLLKIKASLPA